MSPSFMGLSELSAKLEQFNQLLATAKKLQEDLPINLGSPIPMGNLTPPNLGGTTSSYEGPSPNKSPLPIKDPPVSED